ncbi:DUF2279 domain-containing protein [Luteibaculum oceani]|uniref:DUF2279 domain-containing protein n=1 Tax=Luteibaculum oceani TaxID=1294296 RepID=A0A5C6VAM1_9FLAO|nr:DUF2279 domain-containing protein [Luteibaculum oceani]TXC81376.1 DUF2279 domain-containing protein [Luteibaculum oceani]
MPVSRKFWINKLITICLLVTASPLNAMEGDSIKRKSFPIIPVEIGLLASSQVGLSIFWYQDGFSHFKFRDDIHQWRGMDKAGHIMSAFQVTRSNIKLCELSGLESSNAKKWALLSTSIFYTGIEVLDGFSSGYGFSLSDFVANGIGIGLAGLPDRMQARFSLRISYRPSPYAQYRPELLGKRGVERFFKDYNGQIYWLSLWKNEKDHWSDVFGLSLGYGVEGLLGGSKNPDKNQDGMLIPEFLRSSKFSLALDVKLTRLLPNNSKAIKWLKLLDFIKIPMPGVFWCTKQRELSFGFPY